ncbi:MAG: ABC transporter substrate-binding protein [Caldilineaceae bacterium]|nr:ABC transporter substrate-binding protein [Caldilineaceae bacterium]HRJ44054.1 ABC transporter substrate-binding protein [Caldilineaceae bacterium]
MSKTKNRFSALIAVFVILSVVLAGCAAPPPPAVPSAAAPAAEMSEMDKLIAAAQAEGSLTTIALPHDWCNYGESIETFKAKYGIAINELDPNAGSGDEIEAVKANMNNKGPQAPDVLDVGFGFGPQLVDEKLSMAYKVATWDTIPGDAKHPDGAWVGDYYGVLSFLVNTDVVTNVPQDWADLLKPEYKGQIALAGDPRVSNQAIMAVYAAALANGGSLDNVQPGLDFFAELNAAGNLIPVISKGATLAKGETPIVIAWDYNALSWQQQFEDNPRTEVVVPASGIIGGVYIQAISAYAPQPNAAKLWQEFLYSDEGQLIWLKGFCHPIRYNDLAARNVIPQEIADALPPADLYAKAVFPNLDQLAAAKEAITTQWDSVVGADVKASE